LRRCDRSVKQILGTLINVGGFALVLLVAFLIRHVWWGFVLDIALVWFLWAYARPAAAGWTRDADLT